MKESMIWSDPEVARKVACFGGDREATIEAALSCQGSCGHSACVKIAAEVVRMDPQRAEAAGVVLDYGSWPDPTAPYPPVCCHTP